MPQPFYKNYLFLSFPSFYTIPVHELEDQFCFASTFVHVVVFLLLLILFLVMLNVHIYISFSSTVFVFDRGNLVIKLYWCYSLTPYRPTLLYFEVIPLFQFSFLPSFCFFEIITFDLLRKFSICDMHNLK